MEQIPLALISLSVGWGMHRGLSQRYCFRCTLRKTSLRAAKWFLQLKHGPTFARRYGFILAATAFINLVGFEIASVLGWKILYDFVRVGVQVKFGGKLDARKETENVSRS